MNRVKLSDTQIEQVVNLPETGMGYHKVQLVLTDGIVLKNMVVVNSEFLLVDEGMKITPDSIKSIELEEIK